MNKALQLITLIASMVFIFVSCKGQVNSYLNYDSSLKSLIAQYNPDTTKFSFIIDKSDNKLDLRLHFAKAS